MAKQKTDDGSLAHGQDELVKRVDAMMDPKHTSVTSSLSVPLEKHQVLTTAPELPGSSKPKPAKKAKKIEPIDSENPESKLVTVAVKKAAKLRLKKPKPPEPTTEAVPVAIPEAEPPEPSINLDDSNTEKAVDDIVVQEADTVLAVEDAQRSRKQRDIESRSKSSGGFWSALGTVILIFLIIGIIASIVALVVYGA